MAPGPSAPSSWARASAVWRRDLLRGLVLGLVVGAVLGALSVLLDFPEWLLVTWGFVLCFAVFVLPVQLIWRFALTLGVRYLNGPDPRKDLVDPADGLGDLRPGDVLGVAFIVTFLVLTLVWLLGDGRGSPF